MDVGLLTGSTLADAIPRLTEYACGGARSHPARNPRWLMVLQEGFGHVPYALNGEAADLRTDNPRYSRVIRLWQRLPVRVTRVLGPSIVRGIP